MKNILLVLFSTALLSSMACTNGKAGNDDKSNKKTETKQPAENKSGDEAVKAIHLTKAQFLEKVWDYEKNPDKWVYKGDKPCIIDFYADWCRPCKIAGPILEELAGEYKGQIYVYKINTEQERELAGAFGIQSIPAFLHCPMV
ncbi:MAG TPA: thiol reductase thioredoxin, partial [Marinilabiliales bacterium]|nr:thiol reductase thioredoxin [Marinilabiliales bacterium]